VILNKPFQHLEVIKVYSDTITGIIKKAIHLFLINFNYFKIIAKGIAI
jgi:hypothetical protein